MDLSDVVSGLVGAVIGGGITGWFTLRGVDKSGEQARLLASEAAARDREAAAVGRLRDRNLRALDETRQLLVDQLSWLERRVLTDPGNPDPPAPPTVDDKTRSNINLVGDYETIRAYTDVVVELSRRLPMTRGEARRAAARLPTIADLDTVMIDRSTKARALLLKTLDEQEERVLRDLPMAALTVEGLAKLAGPEALLEALRERQRGDAGGDHEEPPPDR